MGRALARAFPESREVFERADRALGAALSETCFEGPDEALSRTETTQPALLTVSTAALAALAARGARPARAAGHSLGEWSAHVAAGTISFDDAVRTVRARGRFMQEAVPEGRGAMAAVLGLPLEALVEACAGAAQGEVVSPANLNGPGQIVIAGHAGAVRRASDAALAAGAKRVVPLPVSAPFHCSLMTPAADRLEGILGEIAWSDPAFPVYTNVDAAPVDRAGAARSALVRQVASTVRWEEEVARMVADGVTTFVEVGPGKVLSGLIRRIEREVRVLQVSDPESLGETLRALEAAA